jgi:hypothetical protein
MSTKLFKTGFLLLIMGFNQPSGNSPSGLIIGEYYASDENEYSFCPNGRLKLLITENCFYSGNWSLNNDTIFIHLDSKFIKKGIGSVLPPPDRPIPNNCSFRFKLGPVMQHF